MRRIVTTSWDDGHPLDLRLAELLESHGLRGTFYVPRENPEREVLRRADLRALAECSGELGAHTLGHVDLTSLAHDAARREIVGSKEWLEQEVGRQVSAFCYPRGRHDGRIRAAAADAGFALGRTTLGAHLDAGRDPWCLPVTLQAYPHRGLGMARHAAKHGDLPGALRWASLGRMDFDRQLETLVERFVRDGGVFHLWGHSWEVDDLGWWDRLDRVFGRLAAVPDVEPVTNGQLALELFSR